MNSARKNNRQILDHLLTRNPIPSSAEMQSRLDTIWERLRSEIENTSTGHVSISVSIRPYWALGKAPWVVAGVVLAAILVSAVVWRNGPPFSTASNTSNADETLSKSSSEQGAEALQLTVPDAFELASVKLVPESSQAFEMASMGETSQLMWMGCPGGYTIGTQLEPGRLTIPGSTVLTLVMLAYGRGRDCTLVDGGPAWARSGEYYEIQALLPQGTPRETTVALLNGEAPRVQRMLQTLLADRFRLVLEREMKETPVYVLTVADPGKMKLSPEETLAVPSSFLAMRGMPFQRVGRGLLISAPGTHLFGHAVSMSDLVRQLRQFAGRIVVDKTGRSDSFDVDLTFTPNTGPTATAVPPPVLPPTIPPPPGAPPQSTATVQGPSLQDALEDQLGIKMQAARMPVEVLVIESVERPSEN